MESVDGSTSTLVGVLLEGHTLEDELEDYSRMECGLLESVSPLSTARPQRSHVVHTLVHKCEYPDFLEMRDGNRTGSARVGTPCGQLSVARTTAWTSA